MEFLVDSIIYLRVLHKGGDGNWQKKQRNQHVTTAFHYLVKSMPDDGAEDGCVEDGFSRDEFDKVVNLLRDTQELDDTDEKVVLAIKDGKEMHRRHFEEIGGELYFGVYEGAYYGQKIRNNILGEIDPESLNLRSFFYLITRLRDGKILIGVTYHGNYGDYEGFRSYLSYHLRGNYRVASKTLKSIATEIGDGYPVSLKLTYRKGADRPERKKVAFWFIR